ncbi:hypothetical protein [Streptomyces sp. NPDC053560]|uniref:hypothetical protein n=1 Tax=Streptomyces sp. NPDC053560 TaxID=3365711 RepID=UPI0037CE8541
MTEFAITVWQMDKRDGRRVKTEIAFMTKARTAPEMEDEVTRLHEEYPAPGWMTEVDTVPLYA